MIQEQLYPIRYISEKSGIKPVTLRAWEKRYNILKPHRTEKGHRLYTHSDLDKVNRIVALINQGMTISQAIELLKDKKNYDLVSDNKYKFLVNFDAVSYAVKQCNYQVAIKEINTIYADYSPEAFAQVIYPALYKELVNKVWAFMNNADLNREIILDLIINRLMNSVQENNYHANQQAVQVIGFKTGMLKKQVIKGLFIANILKAHGYRVTFCSGVSSIETIISQSKKQLTIIFTNVDLFYLNQIDIKSENTSQKILVWINNCSESFNNLHILVPNYTQLYNQIKNVQTWGVN